MHYITIICSLVIMWIIVTTMISVVTTVVTRTTSGIAFRTTIGTRWIGIRITTTSWITSISSRRTTSWITTTSWIGMTSTTRMVAGWWFSNILHLILIKYHNKYRVFMTKFYDVVNNPFHIYSINTIQLLKPDEIKSFISFRNFSFASASTFETHFNCEWANTIALERILSGLQQ